MAPDSRHAAEAVSVPIILMSSGFIAPALGAVRQHWRVIDIECQREALAYLRNMAEPPVAICIGRALDIGDDLDAWQMLAAVQAEAPGVPVLISTRQASPKVIVDLVKHGAFDYVLEPQDREDPEEISRYVQDLVFSLTRAVRWRQVVLENAQLREDLALQSPSTAFIGRSLCMSNVLELVRKVAPTEATVLISGESGTGKELAARALHDLSARRGGPFVALNCGPSRRRSSPRSSSATSVAPSPAPMPTGRGSSARPLAEPSFSMRSAPFRRASR
jgi:DNA-binding NtrC family response regulator